MYLSNNGKNGREGVAKNVFITLVFWSYLYTIQSKYIFSALTFFSEVKFAREIGEISELHGVQMNWRDLAQKCGVNITSRFDYPKNGSISVDNKVYTFTMNKCTFRRITTPPMSDQEKCLVILSVWVKNLQNTHQVTSLIPLLKRKNINYLTGYISYFYILLPFLNYVFILGGGGGHLVQDVI